MRGEFIGVWAETWKEIWLPLTGDGNAPIDIYSELYRELIAAMTNPPNASELAAILPDPELSRDEMEKSLNFEYISEQSLISFLEISFEVLEDIQGDALSNRYFNLLSEFIDKYSLRYDLRRPCKICPNLSGMFTGLVRQLKEFSRNEAHIFEIMNSYEEAIRDLSYGATEDRIKTCLSKQFMLLEAIGSLSDDITKTTLGAMCDEITSWPHITIRESIKKLYGFASDYPGIRHGGNPAGKIRSLEMRDMIAVSILLAGYSPYLNAGIDTDEIYSAIFQK